MSRQSIATSDQSPLVRRPDLPTSVSLLVRLRAQDQAAWREFLTLYAPLVVRWCHRRGLAEADIADVAQEVFSRVARGIGQFRKEAPEDSFRGWLARITHREIGQLFRRKPAVGRGGSEALAQLHQYPARIPAEPEEDVRQEMRYLYHRAVELVRGEFSDLAWQMFWRVAVDGNPAPAVAEEMDTTPAAVRQAKSRILRRLKEVVGDLPN